MTYCPLNCATNTKYLYAPGFLLGSGCDGSTSPVGVISGTLGVGVMVGVSVGGMQAGPLHGFCVGVGNGVNGVGGGVAGGGIVCPLAGATTPTRAAAHSTTNTATTTAIRMGATPFITYMQLTSVVIVALLGNLVSAKWLIRG